MPVRVHHPGQINEVASAPPLLHMIVCLLPCRLSCLCPNCTLLSATTQWMQGMSEPVRVFSARVGNILFLVLLPGPTLQPLDGDSAASESLLTAIRILHSGQGTSR